MLTIPPTLKNLGFTTPELARRKKNYKYKRLMVNSDGLSDTGKTEFMLSAPGPGAILVVDRGFDGVFDNKNPPEARRDDFAIKVLEAPMAQMATQETYNQHWQSYLTDVRALAQADIRTIGIDGDGDTWELQRLAAHGKLTGVFPQTRYTDVYAARRALINFLWDSGKVVIATNKLRPEFKKVVNAKGEPVVDEKTGEQKRESTGNYERAGYHIDETNYLWQVVIRHLHDPKKGFGLRILKAKSDPEVVGMELWGSDCNFQGLVQAVYPQYPLSDWGY